MFGLKQKLQERVGISLDKLTVSLAGKPLTDDDERIEDFIMTNSWYSIDVNHVLEAGGMCTWCRDDAATVSLPCKCHAAFCSNCFFHYCDYMASKGNTTITCPVCSEEYDLNDIQNASIISDSQFRQLSEKLSQNHFNSKQEYAYDYTELLDLLSKAKKMTIEGIPNCPSIRLCPSCGTVVGHQGGGCCKHMRCETCHKEYCFVCLTDWKYSHSYHTNCTPAPIQTSVPHRK